MWWLGLPIGGLLVIAALFVYAVITTTYDSRAAAQQRRIMAQRTAAEHQMQKVVQDTIGEMFRQARRFQ